MVLDGVIFRGPSSSASTSDQTDSDGVSESEATESSQDCAQMWTDGEGADGPTRSGARERIEELARMVHLDATLLDSYPSGLSGGRSASGHRPGIAVTRHRAL